MVSPPGASSATDSEETAEALAARFYSLLQNLTTKVPQAQSESDLASLRDTLAEVRHLFSCGTQWWVGYDVRKAQESIRESEYLLDAATRRLKPRQRFRFREHPRVKPASEDGAVGKARKDVVVLGESCIHVDEAMVKDGAVVLTELRGKDVNVGGIQNAKIVLKDVAGALRVVDVERCEIMAAGVAGSVHVTRAKECIFWVRCRQVRVHESSDCLIWLDVRGEPVIEGCSGMRFGPVEMKGVDEVGEKASVGGDGNRWADVKDFQWLMKGQSPNWRIVGEEERVGGVLEFTEGGTIKVGMT